MERAKASIIDCLDDYIDTWYNKLVTDKYILRNGRIKIFVRIKNFQAIQLVNKVKMLFSKRRHYIL